MICYVILPLLLSPISTSAKRVNGLWSPGTGTNALTVLSKFGFQRADPLRLDQTRGHIFGNVTSVRHSNASSNIDSRTGLLLIIDEATYKLLDANLTNSKHPVCPTVYHHIGSLAWHRKCLQNNSWDMLRTVPCPRHGLCEEEAPKPDMVVRGYQYTFRVHDNTPRFWYLLLVPCSFTSTCTLATSSPSAPMLYYDVWLTNGAPHVRHLNPFEHQFSFEQQDVVEIYAASVLVFALLLCSQAWAYTRAAHKQSAMAILVVLAVELSGLLLNTAHVLLFAFDGSGLPGLHVLGDGLVLLGERLLVLLLLLFGRGWSLQPGRTVWQYATVLWSVYVALYFLLFAANSLSVDELEDVDIFETWTGYCILALRLSVCAWFLVELRRTAISYDNRRLPLQHFGAAYAVWFVYPSVLALVLPHVHMMWRFKLTLGIQFLADFTALFFLVHLFWPVERPRKPRHRSISDDLEDFERSLLMDDEERAAE